MKTNKKPTHKQAARTLAHRVREWMLIDAPLIDAGESDIAQVMDWASAFLAAHPDHIFAREWQAAGESAQKQMKSDWERLRGPSIPVRAATYAERQKQRAIAKNPLFAAMGALEEVATLTTAGEIESNLRRSRAELAADNALPPKPTLAERVKARRDPNVRYPGLYGVMHLSENETSVWRHVITFGPKTERGDFGALPLSFERIAAARAELCRLVDGDAGRACIVIDAICSYFEGRQLSEEANVAQGIAALRALRPRTFIPLSVSK